MFDEEEEEVVGRLLPKSLPQPIPPLLLLILAALTRPAPWLPVSTALALVPFAWTKSKGSGPRPPGPPV